MRNRNPIPQRFSFDEGYYHKYYGDPRTRVGDETSCAVLADFLFAYLRYLEITVKRVLDIGCGTGRWHAEVRRHHPAARYTGVERSEYACRKYGWKQGCVTSFRSKTPFDLVICHDVLQYLNDAEAETALRNLTGLTRFALHLQVLTTEDWEQNCDQTVTDGKVYLRRASWYRERLQRDFLSCGGGLFLVRKRAPVLYELEVLA